MSQASSWNFTIQDTSPVIDFKPYSDDFPSWGWQPWFSESGFFNSAAGERANGDSWHITNASEASLAFNFHGTNVYLFGNASRPYNVTIDSDTVPLNYTGDNLLFQSTSLNLDNHSVRLEVTDGSGDIWFDKAVVTDSLPSGVVGFFPMVIDSQNRTALNYIGNWEQKNDTQIPSTNSPKPYMETSVTQSSLSMNFTGGIAVAVDGSRNYGHWTYNVTLNGATTQYNASTFWLIGDAVLFYQSGLDPREPYFLEIVPSVGQWQGNAFSLNDITVYMANQTGSGSLNRNTSSSKSSVGVIVGTIFGAVLIAFLIALFICRRRRGHSRQTKVHIVPYPSTSNTQTAQYIGSVVNPVSQSQTSMSNVDPPPSSFHPNPQRRKSNLFATQPQSQLLVPTTGISARQPEINPAQSVSSGFVSNTSPVMSPTVARNRDRQSPSVPVSVNSEVSPSHSAGSLPPQAVDLDHIVELIARRIDLYNGQADRPDVPPPQYRAV